MNYQKIYDMLITSAHRRGIVSGYTEKHHIIPKSMGGSNKKHNIVTLTAKEHYIAHHLLFKIYRNAAMTYAFWRMCNTAKKRDYHVTAGNYAYIKEQFVMIIRDTAKNRPRHTHSSETIEKMKYAQLGHTVSKETRDKISNSRKGKSFYKHTQEHKDILRERMQGNLFGKLSKGISKPALTDERKKQISEQQTGKVLSEITKKKMSDAKIGKKFKEVCCPHCSKIGGANTMKRWHFANCKQNSRTS